jgi:hypothetical protein
MFNVRNQELGLSLQSYFFPVLPYSELNPSVFGLKILKNFQDYGLHPNGIYLLKGNELFTHEMGFKLFANRANFQIHSDKMDISFEHARTQKDIDVVFDCVLKMIGCLPEGRTKSHTISVTSHSVFDNKNLRNLFFGKFKNEAAKIQDGGVIAYSNSGPGDHEIRLLIERSQLNPETGVFVAWTLNFLGDLNLDLLRGIQVSFRDLSDRFDLRVVV